jgi:hypothetical protein
MQSFVGKLEGKRLFGRPRSIWEDNIKLDLEAIGSGVDWIGLTQDEEKWRDLVNAVMNLQFPYKAENC